MSNDEMMQTCKEEGVLGELHLRTAVIFAMLVTAMAFIYPWAVIFKDVARGGLGLFLLTVFSIFIAILCLALFCAFRTGRGDGIRR